MYSYLKDQHVALIFKNDLRHMATAAVPDEEHSVRPILSNFFEQWWPYVLNHTNNVSFQGFQCCWIISKNQ